MLEPGEKIDRYEVEALLGSGGVAAVYRVRHVHLGTRHALKVLLVTVPSVRSRLVAEGRVQARLRHANLVAVTDVLFVHRSPALVMELVDGPSLDAVLATRRLPLDEALELFRGIVTGVGAAHAVGLVHRDLKPANVLLAKGPGGRSVPKIMDFGLVKAVGQEVGHTRSDTPVGTPAYMAPEQVRDASAVDQRADLWALGCVLFELVTGHRPFPSEDLFEVYAALRSGRFPDPVTLAPDAPQRVLSTIRKLLQPEPDLRVRTCAELYALLWDDPVPDELRATPEPLDALSGDTPAPAVERPASAPPPAERRTGLSLAVLAAALAVALLVAVRVFLPVEPPPAPRPAPAPAPPPVPVPVPVPVPAPAPAPAPPTPTPTPPPTPTPKAPRPPVRAPVTVEGDAAAVWLESDGRRVDLPASVQPGTWTVRATFGDRVGVDAGELRVADEAPVKLRCASFLFRCTVLRP